MKQNKIQQSTKLNGLLIHANDPFSLLLKDKLMSSGIDLKEIILPETDYQPNKTTTTNESESINSIKYQSTQSLDYCFIVNPLYFSQDHFSSVVKFFTNPPSPKPAGKCIIIQSLINPSFLRQPVHGKTYLKPQLIPIKLIEDLVTKIETADLGWSHVSLVYLKDIISGSTKWISQTDLLLSVISQKKLLLVGDQSNVCSPLFLNDAVNETLKISFGRTSSVNRHLIESETKQPIINLAFIAQRIAQEKLNLSLQIVTAPIPHQPSLVITNYSLHQLKPSIQIDDYFHDQIKSDSTPSSSRVITTSISHSQTPTPVIQAVQQPEKSQITKPALLKPVIIPKKPTKKKKLKPAIFFALSFFFGSLLIIISLLLPSAFLYSQSTKNIDINNHLDPSFVDTKINQIDEAQKINIFIIRSLNKIPYLNNSRVALWLETTSSSLEITAKTNYLNYLIGIIGVDAIKSFVTGDKNPTQDINFLINKLDSKRHLVSRNSSKHNEGHILTSQIRGLSLISKLISKPEPIILAVLLQNHLELRPSGGFIEAVSIITIENGVIQNRQTYNSYYLDSQLMGVVEPPDDLNRLLGEKNWYLRDANWDPNFINTAQKVRWFIEKQIGTEVDIVISLNSYTLGQLLESLNHTVNHNEQMINAKNLNNKLIDESLDSSPDKTPIISVVFDDLLSAITDSSDKDILKFISSIFDNVTNNQISIVINDKNSLRELIELGWSGEVVKPECPLAFESKTCIADYLHLFETNIGINKANIDISKNREHSITIYPDKIEHQHTLKFNNQSKSNTWPRGNYRSYLRWFLPLEANNISVQLNNTAIDNNGFSIESSGVHQIIKHSTQIEVNSSQLIQLKYEVPIPADLVIYTWLTQKQPGTTTEPISVTISPFSRIIVSSNLPMSNQDNMYQFQHSGDNNLFLAIDLN